MDISEVLFVTHGACPALLLSAMNDETGRAVGGAQNRLNLVAKPGSGEGHADLLRQLADMIETEGDDWWSSLMEKKAAALAGRSRQNPS